MVRRASPVTRRVIPANNVTPRKQVMDYTAVRWQWATESSGTKKREERVQTVSDGGIILDFGPNIYPLLWYHPDTRLRAMLVNTKAKEWEVSLE